MGNMRFKVGDRVRIKSLDWYNENKTSEGCLVCGSSHINPEMICMLGKTVTISSVEGNYYRIKEYAWNWTDEMIEGLVEEEEIEFTEEDKYWCDIMSESDPTTYVLPEGYIFKDENGNVINATKIVLEKKKKEYPKTYKECYQITGLLKTSDIYGYKNGLLFDFQKLLIARDAYWKIAGEEMGLGKPWEPGYTEKTVKYCLRTNYGRIVQTRTSHDNHPFSFPTEEMRDAFKENFKDLIETCKELL